MKNLCLIVAVVFMCVTGFVGVMAGESVAASQSAASSSQQQSEKVDINSADTSVLITLPGVGEKTAADIISYREQNGKFKSIDELEQVKGIGSKKLAKMRPYIQDI